MTTDSWGSVTKWIHQYVVCYFVCSVSCIETRNWNDCSLQLVSQCSNVLSKAKCVNIVLSPDWILVLQKKQQQQRPPLPFCLIKTCFWLPEPPCFRLSILMVCKSLMRVITFLTLYRWLLVWFTNLPTSTLWVSVLAPSVQLPWMLQALFMSGEGQTLAR